MGITLKNSLHTRRQPWLIPTLGITFFFLLAQLIAASEYTYGPVTVHFAKGSAEITSSSLKTIKKLAATLQGKHIREIRIEGFSDNISVSKQNPFADNKALTLARAENVFQTLQSESGLDPQIFKTLGHGDTGEIAPNDTEEGQAKNRRVEIRVVIEDQPPTATVSSPSPLAAPPTVASPPRAKKGEERVTLNLRKVDIAEVFEMLSKQKRVNIVLQKDVTGTVNVNMYEVTLDDAIKTIASASGYLAKTNDLGYFIMPREGTEEGEGLVDKTEIRTYPIQYAEPEKVEGILSKHLSKAGKATALKDRNLIVVEDTPLILDKIELLINEVDHAPQQILIEAKILEITLDETESFGLDWWNIFSSGTGSGEIGVRGLSNSETGFIFNLVNANVNITLNALNKKGKVKTLSTPKILTLENQESAVIIGDRKGYPVTTTINTVTTTSIEFLESGVILRVTPSVDSRDRILLQIHPEVSSGSVTAGIPSQSTTEVTTSLLADNGQTIFIGGLLKKKSGFSKEGVPVLEDIPLFGRAFSNSKDIQENTETVVLITPYIIAKDNQQMMSNEIIKVDKADTDIQKNHTGKIPSGQ